jgi:hypothetical protein
MSGAAVKLELPMVDRTQRKKCNQIAIFYQEGE